MHGRSMGILAVARWRVCAVAVALMSVAEAHAQTAAPSIQATLDAWGLSGVWAQDCSLPAGKPFNLGFNYYTTYGHSKAGAGGVDIRVESQTPPRTATMTSARVLSDGSLQIEYRDLDSGRTLREVLTKSPDGQRTRRLYFARLSPKPLVFVLDGRNQTDNRAKGSPTSWRERCHAAIS